MKTHAKIPVGSSRPIRPINPKVVGEKVYHPPRTWQMECIKTLIGERLALCNVPTGAGKSYFAIAFALNHIAQCEKVVIAVPQREIGTSFTANRHMAYDEKLLDWELPRDLVINCPEGERKRTVLLRHLQSPFNPLVPVENAIVVTHATAQSIAGSSKVDFSKVCLIVDESHHVSGEDEEANRIAKLVKRVEEAGGTVLLLTATFHRADMQEIIPEERLKNYTTYILPFDKYLSTLEHIKSIEFQHLVGKEKDMGSLVAGWLRRKPDVPSLVFIPRPNSYMMEGYSRDMKEGEKHTVQKAKITKSIREHLADPDTEVSYDQKTGVYHITVAGEQRRFVEVATLKDRETKRKYLRSLQKSPKEDFPETVVALQLLQEGWDYPYASRVAILGVRSITMTLQMVGRALRDVPDKPNVEVCFFLPKPSKKQEKELLEWTNQFSLFVIGQMMIIEMATPAEYKTDFEKKRIAQGKSPNPLMDLGICTNWDEIVELRDAIQTEAELLMMAEEGAEHPSISDVLSALEMAAIAVIKKELTEQDYTDIAEYILDSERNFQRKRKALEDGVSYGKVPMDPIDLEYVREKGWPSHRYFASDVTDWHKCQEIRVAASMASGKGQAYLVKRAHEAGKAYQKVLEQAQVNEA